MLVRMQRARHGETFTDVVVGMSTNFQLVFVMGIRGVGDENTAGNSKKSDDPKNIICASTGVASPLRETRAFWRRGFCIYYRASP